MQKKWNRRDFIKTGLIAGSAAAIPMSASPVKASSKSFKMRIQTNWPSGAAYYDPIFVGFTELVKEASNGELLIEPLPYNTVVPTKDMFEAVGRGLLDMCWGYPAYWMGKLPVASHLMGQAFTWSNFENMWAFMKYYGGLDIIRKAYGNHGLYLLGPVAAGSMALFSKKPLVKPDDFKNYKVRTMGMIATVFKKMGATPVFFSTSELYQSLQTGVCDGAHWGGIFGGYEMKLNEVTKYISYPFLCGITNCEIFINQKKWASLPKDFQTIVQNACEVINARSVAFAQNKNVESLAKVRAQGGEISYLNEDSLALLKKYSFEAIDELSAKDPKYSKPVGDLLKDFMNKNI